MSEIKFKALVVDDEPDILELIAAYVGDAGFEVVSTTDPIKALDLAKANAETLAIVVSDFRFPESDGFQLRKSLLDAELRDVPFLIVSGAITREMALSAVDLAIAGFLEKPIAPEAIQSLVKEKSQPRIQSLKEDLEMKLEFKGDALLLLEEIEPNILQLESNPHDVQLVNSIMRLLHTIKGTAGCLGLPQVASFSHTYEDFLGPVKRCEVPADKEVVGVMLKAFDTLSKMVKGIGVESYTSEQVEGFKSIFELKPIASNVLPLHAPEKAADGATPAPTDDRKEKETEIPVPTAMLDDFMEQSGELTVLRSMVVKHVKSLEAQLENSETLDRLVELLDEMHQVSSGIQGRIVDIRKLPLRNVLRQLPRVARDASRVTGKNVNLNLEGQDLRVDTTIANVLQNTLVHLIRNSVDHGVEPETERVTLGKPKTGTVTVNCYESGEFVVVEISDDGRGIDPKRIKKKLLEKQLFPADIIEAMSDKKLQTMIFEPGFSTAEKVTEVSGRGVGMDMVKTSVTELGGQIDLQSTVGQGTTTKLILPIPKSVLIIKALFLQAGPEVLALRQDDIVRVLTFDKTEASKQISRVQNRRFLRFESQVLPIVPLHEILSLPKVAVESQDRLQLIVIKTDGYVYAVEVDSILENEEIVVKNLSQAIKRNEIFSGATFLGDGRVALVLDSKGLAKAARVEKAESSSQSSTQSEEAAQQHSADQEQMLLVTDGTGVDSLIPLNRVFRLEEFDFQKIESVGEIRVVHYNQAPLPLHSIGVDPASEPNGRVRVVVLRTSESELRGLMVKDIREICQSGGPIDENVKDLGIRGSLFYDGRTLPVLDIDYWLGPSSHVKSKLSA